MPITINGSGTVTGINAGGLPDGVITTDDIAASAITRTKMGYAGAILQVVQATYSTEVGSSSATYADTGLTASITPSSSSNKVLVMISHGTNHKSAAYATESDPLFFKAQRGEATIEEWQAKAAEIRSRYPYPAALEATP